MNWKHYAIPLHRLLTRNSRAPLPSLCEVLHHDLKQCIFWSLHRQRWKVLHSGLLSTQVLSCSTSTSVSHVMPKSLWTCPGMLISLTHSAFNSVTRSLLSFTFLRRESHSAQRQIITFKNVCWGPQLLHICLPICCSIFSRTRKFLNFKWGSQL